MLRIFLNTRKPNTISNNRTPSRETNECDRTSWGTRSRAEHGQSQPATTNTMQIRNTEKRRKKQCIPSQPWDNGPHSSGSWGSRREVLWQWSQLLSQSISILGENRMFCYSYEQTAAPEEDLKEYWGNPLLLVVSMNGIYWFIRRRVSRIINNWWDNELLEKTRRELLPRNRGLCQTQCRLRGLWGLWW